MALDYWAGSIKDDKWVWAEPVKTIASRTTSRIQLYCRWFAKRQQHLT